MLSPQDRLIVALDLPSVEVAAAMVERLGPEVGFYKVGLELAFAGGLDFARRLIGEGKRVFLDLKLHDIPNTVTRATAQIATLGATFLTIHAYPQTMRAALEGVGESGLKLLGVTVLTSADDADLAEAGYGLGIPALVERRAAQAAAIGLPGLVLSPLELGSVRAAVGSDLLLVTPGIRPDEAAKGDQKRTLTPAAAVRAGADHLVIGRPITAAPDPRAAAVRILREIATAWRAPEGCVASEARAVYKREMNHGKGFFGDSEPRRGYHHGRLKDALVDAARRLVAERGLAGFTLAEAAKLVGVTGAAPYRHFSDRNALVEELVRRGFEQFGAKLRGAWDGGQPNARTALQRMGEAYLGFAREEPGLYTAMFGNVQTLSAPGPGAAATEALELLRRAAAATLPGGDARSRGARDLALDIWSISHGVAMLALAGHLDGEADANPADVLQRSSAALVDAAVKREQAKMQR